MSRTFGEGRVALKTEDANRDIDIPPELASVLREYRAACLFSTDTDYIFTTDSGRPLAWPNVDTFGLGRAFKLAKLPEPKPRFHDLRHTFASMLIADGADVEYVSGQLGHADSAITLKVYTHSFNRAKAAAQSRKAMGARLGNIVETPARTNESEPSPAKVVHLREVQDSRGIAAEGSN